MRAGFIDCNLLLPVHAMGEKSGVYIALQGWVPLQASSNIVINLQTPKPSGSDGKGNPEGAPE